VGKLPTEELQRLLRCVRKHPRVIIPPTLGYDSGVHFIDGNKCFVVSTDPCLGVPEKWFGWLLVHYAASDVALFGARPEFCAINLLGPHKMEASAFVAVMKQVCAAAEELNMAVVTGHTGTYDELSTLVGTCTAYGTVDKDKLITPGGAQAGDSIIYTKQIGLETVINFAVSRRALAESLFNTTRTLQLQDMVTMQTCVKEAFILAELKGVHAMHDTTEGGLVAALNEMAGNSNLGFTVKLEMLPISEEARVLQRHFNLSQNELLSMSSTGNLLAAVDPGTKKEALRELRKQGKASWIGTFTRSKGRLIQHGEKRTAFPSVAEDPYARIMMK
jgi:hydrogenase expression/formation protein HypE